MSVRILVTPEELDQIGQQFKNAAEQGRQQNNQLSNAIHSLEGRWDGMTKKRFWEEFQQSQKHMQAYAQLLESIDQELRTIATRFRQADTQ